MKKGVLLMLSLGVLFCLVAVALLSWVIDRDEKASRVDILEKARAAKAAKREEKLKGTKELEDGQKEDLHGESDA